MPGDVKGRHIAQMADQIGIGSRFALSVAQGVAGILPAALKQAVASVSPALTPGDVTMARRVQEFAHRLTRQGAKRVLG